MKDWTGTGDSGDSGHGSIVKVTDPDADREIAGESKAPIIPKIRGGSGFDCTAKGKSKDRIISKSSRAGLVVGKDICDQKTSLGAERVDRVGFTSMDQGGWEVLAESRDCCVSIGEGKK